MNIFENLPRPEQTTYHSNNALNLFMAAVRDAILIDKFEIDDDKRFDSYNNISEVNRNLKPIGWKIIRTWNSGDKDNGKSIIKIEAY
jgi:hypothetical protein